MLAFSRFKIFFVLSVCVFGFWKAIPNFVDTSKYSFLSQDKVNLGLDLRGGSYLLLEVDFNTYLNDQLSSVVDDVRASLRQQKIGYVGLGSRAGKVKFTIRDTSQTELVEKALSEFRRDFEYDIDNGKVTMTYRDTALKEMRQRVLEQSIEIVRRRVDETGTREPIIQRQGDNRILLQVPGLEDPEGLKRLLGKTAKMTFHLMDETDPFPSTARRPSVGTMLLKGKQGTEEQGMPRLYMVKKKIELSGDLLVDSRASFDRGSAVVSFRFNNLGGKKFAKITKENVNKPFAIVLDNEVISAPRINEPILGGSGIISGTFSVQEANDLSLLLRAGALPAPLEIIEERTVGPSLGQDSIDAGKIASLVGIVVVMFFMFISYSLFGFFSNISLFINIVLVLAALTALQATLTLPGIAGIVLTMGMAVDANVLIFERIREEVRIGKSPLASIDHGFKQAFKTIIDSNITTLIATLLLFVYGSGPVKGFAVTLSIGIICSMFSAVLLTRMLIVLWARKTRPKTLPV